VGEPVHVIPFDGRTPSEEDLARGTLGERERRTDLDDRAQLMFGVDGVDIARRMGFIPGLSVNVAGTREGMTSTFQTITKSILN